MNKLAESRGSVSMMHVTCVVGLAFVLLTTGCAVVKTPPPATSSQSSPPQVDAPAVPQAAAKPPAQSAPPPSADTRPETTAARPTADPAAPSTGASPNQPAGKSAPPVVNAPVRPATAPAPPAQPVKKEAPPPDVAKPKAPPLDLTSLEQRLKDTKAIGVLTKVTLKNQVDDLLDQFRAYYQGKLKTTLADLRRSYDLLVLKVLALLQDGDQALATAIAASREPIWGILSDPKKFATL